MPNTPALLKLRSWLETRPEDERYNMTTWRTCILGAALHAGVFLKDEYFGDDYLAQDAYAVPYTSNRITGIVRFNERAAMHFFGITDEQTYWLFGGPAYKGVSERADGYPSPKEAIEHIDEVLNGVYPRTTLEIIQELQS